MNTIKFMHYRKYDNMFSPSSRGGLTIAYIEDGDTVKYATARCSDKDNFDKAQGRKLAAERLVKTAGVYCTRRHFRKQMDKLVEGLYGYERSHLGRIRRKAVEQYVMHGAMS